MNFACNSDEFLISFQIFPPGCFQGQCYLKSSKQGANISCKIISFWSQPLKRSKGLFFLDQPQIKPCHYLREHPHTRKCCREELVPSPYLNYFNYHAWNLVSCYLGLIPGGRLSNSIKLWPLSFGGSHIFAAWAKPWVFPKMKPRASLCTELLRGELDLIRKSSQRAAENKLLPNKPLRASHWDDFFDLCCSF